MGYNPKSTGRSIESWAELLNKDFKGKVALVNIPQVGVMDAALAIEARGLKKFGDKGNMTKPGIDFLIDYPIPLKKAGHFRAFWENFGQSVNLMVNGEVALESMWSPAVAAITAEEWDYWYDGKPAAKDLADPFGTIIIKKGDVRSGGSYWNRYSKINVWNSIMQENDYLVKRWSEFLAA
jgi:spermidine/putrescine-binding protein